MTYEEFGSEMPDAIDSRSKDLDLSFIMWKQIDTIRNIASREFHSSILLYNDSGSLRNYLPDVLESYCNAIENLHILLSPYTDKEFTDAVEKLDEKGDKRDYHREIYVQCLLLLKRMRLLPKKHRIAETINPKVKK